MWRKPTRIGFLGFLFYRFTRVMSGIYFVNASHVGASFISLAPTFLQKSERAHAAAPPLQIEPAALGFDLGSFDGNRRFCIATRTKPILSEPVSDRRWVRIICFL